MNADLVADRFSGDGARLEARGPAPDRLEVHPDIDEDDDPDFDPYIEPPYIP